ncbi:asparagine synthase (glutamine-hydrolyzing) [Candidatus Laterigemmans baculatus]|uniref:asparagine synthase (glutamine-hydrolyzing) n=1 Tax=Candidatus Laterigemmans baculatus TaxID=2770505 RepID=UPI0013D955E4|nr:asparagine synthase (glutamine-hydrolyzing) [Candidatus Laterigemmans baculatus]
MCGIVGIATSSGMLAQSTLAKMRDTFAHRGPDAAGLWYQGSEGVGLGHRRLAIIDLSADGRQPMEDAHQQIVIVFNGEIYNYRELRSELRGLGHAFRTATDTEVLLAAYRQWGEAFLDRLVGMFALAIYDRRTGRLFLARDRAGEKPLFYYHQAGRLIFASEIKALLASELVPATLDLESFDQFLAYGYAIGERTMIEGVQRLPAGCCMSYHPASDRLEQRRYWSLPELDSGERVDAEEMTDRLEALLSESVRQQLVADVPVGVMLSGGVDSSLVTALAARASARRIKTFTITFPGHGGYDESVHAREVSRYFDTEHIELEAPATSCDLLPRLAAQYDDPIGDSSMICTYMVCEQIRQHATVALGGDGCDELFGGYLHHRWLAQLDRPRRMIPAALRHLGRAALERGCPQGVRGRNWALALLADADQACARFNSLFDTSGRRALLSEEAAAGIDPLRTLAAKTTLARGGRTAVQKATRTDFGSYLCDDILTKVDRASMLASLEVRAPWLDHRLIEFAFRQTPDALRATSAERKILPRRLCERLLPPTLDTRRKQGFSLPLAQWFNGPWGEMMQSVLREADPRLFRPQAIENLIAGQQRGRSNVQRLFCLTVFELWRKEYGIGLPGAHQTAPARLAAA